VVEVVGAGQHAGHQLPERAAGLLGKRPGPAGEVHLRLDPGQHGSLASGHGAQVVGELVDEDVALAAEALGVESVAE